MTIVIRKGDEKEEYANTVQREGNPSAVRLPEYGLRKVAFEPEGRESRSCMMREKFSRAVPVKNERYGGDVCVSVTKVVPR